MKIHRWSTHSMRDNGKPMYCIQEANFWQTLVIKYRMKKYKNIKPLPWTYMFLWSCDVRFVVIGPKVFKKE